MLNLLLGSLLSLNSAVPTLAYESVKCVYSVAGQELKTVSQKMMTLVIDEDLGRFAQIQFGDDVLKVQYQILLENDASHLGSINILQNFLIDETENSVEFSQNSPLSVEISQGAHAVRCELLKSSSEY